MRIDEKYLLPLNNLKIIQEPKGFGEPDHPDDLGFTCDMKVTTKRE